MRWLARIFANAIARRVAYVVVAIALAWCGIGRAEAAVCGVPTRAELAASAGSGQTYTYEGLARAACHGFGPEYVEIISGQNVIFEANGTCTPSGTGNRRFTHGATYVGRFSSTCERLGPSGNYSSSQQGWLWTDAGCPLGTQWNEALKQCLAPCDLNAPPLPEGSGYIPSNGNLGFPANDPNGCPITTCSNSCEYAQPSSATMRYVVIDGTAHCNVAGWNPTGQNCIAGVGGSGPAPGSTPTDSDGDGTSDGNDSAPNNPGQGGGGDENGEGQAEDGSGTCGGDGQPTCGSPGTGSGNGNTSGGGHDCNTPPSSTGDAILAQIAYQTWATRCAITGMGNAGPGNGTGNGDGSGEGTGGEFDGDAEGRDAATEGDSEDPEREDVVEESETEEPELDTSGYGYSRSCVAAPTVTVFGQTITFDTGPMCQWLELASYFVLVLAALGSARIINGGMA